MARVLMVLLVLALGLLAARGLSGGLQAGRQRAGEADGRYRPRKRAARPSGQARARATRAVVRRGSLAHLRDALTGGPLETGTELFRCADCQSFYNVASVRALANDNGARCVNCGSIERIPVEVVD